MKASRKENICSSCNKAMSITADIIGNSYSGDFLILLKYLTDGRQDEVSSSW